MRVIPALFRCLARLAMVLMLAAPATAQGLFSPVVYVNDAPITNYEITQKTRFLQFLGVSGNDLRQQAIDLLIEERLQAQEISRLGGRVTPDQLDAGMAEFAGRANITADEMLSQMQAAGIDRETFVEFIRVGIMWRDLVRALYGNQVAVSTAQAETALSVEGVQPQTEILLSELFLPADPAFAADVQRIIPLVLAIRSESDFANAARQVSVAPTAAAGGRVDRWINVASLPPEVAQAFASASPGTILGPLEGPGAIAFFMLRGKRETRGVGADQVDLVYARGQLPGGNSEANRARVAQIRERVDGCADFPGTFLRAAPELPEDSVEQVTVRQSQADRATLAVLERLNPGEVGSFQTASGSLMVVMLCNRRVAGEGVPSVADMQFSLINRALEGQSTLYVQRLRAEAEIRYN